MILLEKACHLAFPVSYLSLPPACGSDVRSQLLLHHHAYLPATALPAIVMVDLASETVSLS